MKVSVFGQFHPEWGLTLQISIAVLAALLFFASVLAHELAHSLTAQAQGVPVRNITLFLFGGVSNIQRQPPSARAEFLITIVGPITSIALGIIFLVIANFTGGAANVSMTNPQQLIQQLDPFTTLLVWLGPVNILVGLFNMIPGFPLDGGRILRSIFWVATDNLRKATRWASWVGQGVAWLMIGAGIAMVFGVQIPFLGTGFVSGLWLAFIGWFLNSAAVQSYQQIVVQDILEGTQVKEMMRRNPPTVSPNQSVHSLVHDHIMGSDEHAFPVLEDDELVGLVTLQDVREVQRDKWQQVTVAQIMTPTEELATVAAEEDASDAMTKLSHRDVRQLPVVENGKLVGVLRRRDIVQWMQLQSDQSGRQMPDLSRRSS